MFDSNAWLAPGWYTPATTAGTWQDSGYGTPGRGENLSAIISQVIGDPNVQFKVQSSPDQINIFDVALDELGPLNAPGQRFVHFAGKNRYWRVGLVWTSIDPGEGSGNSSSNSGQSFNSSSSGGSMAIYIVKCGLVIANTG